MRGIVGAAVAGLVVALFLVAAARRAPEEPAPGRAGRVAEVVDGDTVRLADGSRVRLVQIDAPELGGRECHAGASSRALRALLPAGTRVTVVADPALEGRDRFGRELRYVYRGPENVNVTLVRRGAAAPWFFEGRRGRFAAELLAAAREAHAARRGLWGACPATRLDPSAGVETRVSRR